MTAANPKICIILKKLLRSILRFICCTMQSTKARALH